MSEIKPADLISEKQKMERLEQATAAVDWLTVNYANVMDIEIPENGVGDPAEDLRRANAAKAFTEGEPRFKKSKANSELMVAYLRANNLGWSVPNLQRAFESLDAQGSLQTNEAAPAPTPKWASLTRSDIARMERGEYARNLKDPEFERAVNAILRGEKR
jgi:hypothetical protein